MQGSQVLKEKCLRLIGDPPNWKCARLLRIRESGRYLTVELVKRRYDEDDVEVVMLADLPQETYVVGDPYFGWYFVAYEDGKLIAVSRSWNSLLRRLRDLGYYVSYGSYLLSSFFLIPHIEKTISAGLSDSGDVVDPFGALDATDYGAEPLKAAYVWIKSMYTGRNAVYAWFNVVALVAQVAASPLRDRYYLRNQYLDYVVYNVEDSGLNLAMYVLEPMLGEYHANGAYGTVIYGAPLSARRGSKLLAARLLDLNRLPLVLAGQTKRTLKVYKYLLESAAGGVVEVGRKSIPNLRSLFIFADALYDDAARSLVLRWERSQMRLPQTAGLPQVKPIYGFAARLWKKYRNRFSTINKLPYLVGATAEAIAQEIRGEAEEVAAFTEQAVEGALKAASIE